MKDLASEMASRFYEIHERVKLLGLGYSASSIVPKKWLELNERHRRDYIEAFRQLLADQQLMDVIARRAEL